jgi:hypothetical protein
MGQISNRCKVNLPQNAKASSTPFHGPICLLWLFCLFVSPFGYWIICNKWRFSNWVHHSLMWISPSTVKLGKIKRGEGVGGTVGEIESFKNCRPNWLIDIFWKLAWKYFHVYFNHQEVCMQELIKIIYIYIYTRENNLYFVSNNLQKSSRENKF